MVALSGGSAPPGAVAAQASVNPREAFASLPLRFEPNRGQTDARVAFLSRGSGHAMLLTRRGAVLKLARRDRSEAVLGMDFVGANPRPKISAGGRLAGVSHYLSGGGVRDVPQYARVIYRDMYEGVDLVTMAAAGVSWSSTLRSPRGRPGRVRLDYSGAGGLRVDPAGGLVLVRAACRSASRRPSSTRRAAAAGG